jgi:hypothetical protein
VDNDGSVERRLDSFINKVTRKRDSPLIREPPKQPLAKPVLPWRSRRLTAESLSRVPVSKQGEVLIIQRMCYTKGPSMPSTSELEVFDKFFDGNLYASGNGRALPGHWKGLVQAAAKTQGHLLGRDKVCGVLLF